MIMNLLKQISKALEKSKASFFKAGKIAKRIEGEFVVRYVWELTDANNHVIKNSDMQKWEGFDSLDEAILTKLK